MTISNAPASRQPSRNRWWIPTLVWGSIALVLVILLASGEADAMLSVLSRADWRVALALLVLGLALPVVHAWRWQGMLRAIDQDVPLAAALDITVTSTMVNYAAPGYLWSPTKGLLARQFHGIGFGKTLPTLAAEQGLDALALLFGSLLGLALVGPSTTDRLLEKLESPSTALLLAVVLGAVLVTALGAVVVRRFVSSFWQVLTATGRMLAADRQGRAPMLGLTLARWVLDVTAIWLATNAVGLSLGLDAAILLSNVPLLIGQISPMPGGVGFREGAMAAIAGTIGVSISAILAAAVLHRAVLLAALPIVLVGVRVGRWGGVWR